jgi:hypothetical protein
MATAPFRRAARGQTGGGCGCLQTYGVDQFKQVDSPIGRQSGILVHVHPEFS